MSVKFKLDSRAIPDGTILLFGIRYVGDDPEGHAWTPVEESKVYTYAMLKAGGFWYVTGGGKTPQAAGWGAVERWLERDGRVVEWVRHVTETGQLWPPVAPQGPDGPGDQVEDPHPCGDYPAPCNCDDPETHDREPLNPGGMSPDGSIDGMC